MKALLPTFTKRYSPKSFTPASVGVARSPQSSVPTLLIRKDGKKIGSYLLEQNVLIVPQEEDRPAATHSLLEGGFAVRAPLTPAVPDEPMLQADASAVGRWGNVLVFDLKFAPPRQDARVALYDFDSGALCVVANELLPGVTRRLNLMGLTVTRTDSAAVPGTLREKLEWDHRKWGANPFGGSRGVQRALTPAAERRVPTEVAAAVNEIFAIRLRDPFPGTGRVSNNGVLDRGALLKLRTVATASEITLPPDWRDHWRHSLEISPSHTPSLTALSLHDAHPDWWDALPTTGVSEQLREVRLVGHSGRTRWIYADETGAEEARMGSALAGLVRAVGDLDWIFQASKAPQDCALCGRNFTPSRLSAGLVAELRTAQVCQLCVIVGTTAPQVSSSPVLEAGAEAAVREVIRCAGRVISESMIPDLLTDGLVDPVTMILLRHALPTATERGWAKWLARAGVLGEGWRPSRGYVSVAADGHQCRSLFERIVDDFLWANGIEHEPEPPYPFDPDLNANGSRADWRLADGRFVEAAGLMTQAAYAEKMGRKVELATKHSIRLVVLTEADLPRLASLLC